MYLNVVQCLWIFSWTLAVSPQRDKRLCTNIFCFSFFFPFLCLYRQSWQRSIDLEIWLMHFSKLKYVVSSYANACSRIPTFFHKVFVGREVTAEHCLGLWILLWVLQQLDSASALCVTSVLKSESLAVPILQMDFWETGGIKPNASKILRGG